MYGGGADEKYLWLLIVSQMGIYRNISNLLQVCCEILAKQYNTAA